MYHPYTLKEFTKRDWKIWTNTKEIEGKPPFIGENDGWIFICDTNGIRVYNQYCSPAMYKIQVPYHIAIFVADYLVTLNKLSWKTFKEWGFITE